MKNNLLLCLLSMVITSCGLAQRPVIDLDALRAATSVMDAGNVALQAGKLEQATQQYELAFQLGKEAEALDGLGCVALRRGDRALALQRYRDALAASPHLSQTYGHIAVVMEEAGKLSDAEAHYQQGLAIKPGDLVLRYEYAQFLKRHGRAADSKVLMAQVRSMIPKPLALSLKSR